MKKMKYIWIPIVACVAIAAIIISCVFIFKGDKEEPSTDEQPVDPIMLANEGVTEYVIVRGNDASKDVISAAGNLWAVFKEKTGTKIELVDEYGYEELGKPKAIVIGTIADEVSVRLQSELHRDDYVVRVENEYLYIIGGCNEATVKAVEWFIGNYLAEETSQLLVEGDLDMKYKHEYPIKTMTIAGTDISEYRIVYDADLYYSRECANKVSSALADACGVLIDIVPDTEAAVENEILVGTTNREESKAAIDAFEKPNYYYSAKLAGKKLVIAEQGIRTGEAAVAAMVKYFGGIEADSCDLTEDNFNLSGDIASTDKKALQRAEGTDLRVFHYNVLGTLSDKENGYSDQQRLELIVDTLLFYSPDVITFNELHTDRDMLYKAMKRMLEPYYTFVEAENLDIFPRKGDTAPSKYSVPIAYRKDAGLTVVDSGFSYLSDMVDYHGSSWVVFDTADGNRFLAVSAHLSQNADSKGSVITTWVEDVIETVNVAREEYGAMPMFMNGDWFFGQGNYYTDAYNYMLEQGVVDVSEAAEKKYSVGIGTSHTIGLGTQDEVEQDLIFVTPEWFNALSHKIIIDFYTVNSSDHYPVMSDLKFVKSAKPDEIPPLSDGNEHLDITDESAGGSGSWSDGTSSLGDTVYKLSEYKNKLKIYGRSLELENGIACDYSGAGIEFNVHVSGDIVLEVYSNGKSYYTLYINGVRQETRLMFENGTGSYTIAEGLVEGDYNIKLIKQTYIEHSLSTLLNLRMTGKFNDKPADEELLIEFIGDSITCGYGTVGNPTENHGSADYMDATRSYAYKTSELLEADHSLVSWSGWAILPDPANGGGSVPAVYGKTNYKRSDALYAPTRTADIVVIHLGTNDLYSRSNYNSDFVAKATEFISDVKEMNPDAKIVWAYGSMMSGSNLSGFKTKVETIISDLGGAQEGLYSVQLPTDTSGARNHPTEANHTEAAAILAQFITDNCID